MIGFLAVCALTVGYSLIAKRMASTFVTAPMVFLGVGALMSIGGFIPAAASQPLLLVVAEVALVVLLFLDAAKTDIMELRNRHVWPLRMLVFGLPLSILLGTLAGAVLLPTWSIMAVALAAAILAPTDAALGQAVVTNPAVPVRSRRALIVESGLNDGLALPAILFLAAVLAAETQQNAGWIIFGAKQILLGPIAGGVIGWLGGWAFMRAKAHGTTSDVFEGIGALALAGTAYLGAVQIGGNGFIASFAAGLAFGGVVKGACKFVYEFTESEGQLLSWAAFFLLGAVLVPDAIGELSWPVFVLILTSLLVVRPVAIWLSLLGTDSAPITRLFFGWFGPRGLATALFALLVAEEIPHALAQQILNLAINAVWISAVLHGVTAVPTARRYGAKIAALAPCAEMHNENVHVKESET